MSILTRPLTDAELEAAGIEPAPVAHETFTQVFAVDRGELEVVEAPYATFDDEAAPKPSRISLAVWAWGITTGAAFGALIYAAGGGQ